MSESDEKKLDATGLFCPEPVFRTKIELEKMQVGEIINVSADDPDAEEPTLVDVDETDTVPVAVTEKKPEFEP